MSKTLSKTFPRLFIETSTSLCALGLEDAEGAFFGFQELLERNQHERILCEIQHLLMQAKLSASDLKSIVVGVGPGSFVGCRLAVAVAQGLALAYDIPLLPLSSLQIGAQCYYEKYQEGAQVLTQVLILNDAKLGEVYQGLYHLDFKSQVMVPVKPDQALELSELAQLLQEPGVDFFLTDHPEGLKSQMGFAGMPFEISAQSMRALAQASVAGDFQGACDVNPVYLRAKSQWVKKVVL